eukprot:4380911-Ditylum_brightwellii.AAC.1
MWSYCRQNSNKGGNNTYDDLKSVEQDMEQEEYDEYDDDGMVEEEPVTERYVDEIVNGDVSTTNSLSDSDAPDDSMYDISVESSPAEYNGGYCQSVDKIFCESSHPMGKEKFSALLLTSQLFQT